MFDRRVDLSHLTESDNRFNLLQFLNCWIVKDHKLVLEDLFIEDGCILDAEKVFFDQNRMADLQVDCKGAIIAPGYIETQINGGYGYDFSSNAELLNEGVQLVAQKLLMYGVTSFLPTIVSSSADYYAKALPKFQPSTGGKSGASVLGLHLEGPFISLHKSGAHQKQHIVENCSNLFQTYGSKDLQNVKVVTLAPELDGAIDAVQRISQLGIRVSLGHSKASITDGEKACANGASAVTHLFNAMSPFHHRDPGLMGLLTSKYIPLNQFYYGMIADGIHTHDAALRIAHRTHPEGLMLISDATAALGMGDGTHRLGDTVIEVKGFEAHMKGTNTLVGSICTLDHCVRRLVKAARCTNVEALECATLHPAQFLGIEDRKGTLNCGSDADFVILDEHLNVQATFIAGELVWRTV